MTSVPAAAAPRRAPWGLALAAGAALGLAHALQIAMPLWSRTTQGPALLAVIASRWVLLFVVLCLVLLWATRAFHARAGAGSPARQLAWAVGLAVLAAVLADPLCWLVSRAVHTAVALRGRPFWAGRDLATVLGLLWSLSLPAAAVLAVMWVVIDRHVDAARRSAQALAATQLRLAGVQRRALDAQLRSVQARVEPAFLFGTLALIEGHFVAAPARAQRALDALIRYLRAALPAGSGATSTVGRQAELVRAWLDIESERAPGRLRASVHVPESLQDLPLAPLILPPLVAWMLARAEGVPPAIDVRVEQRSGGIAVEIADMHTAVPPPGAPPAVIAEIAQRLHALYGERAGISVAATSPRGTRIRVDIPLPGP